MTSVPRDANRVPALLAGSSSDSGGTPVIVYVDPDTHRLLVDIDASDITSVTGVADGDAVNAANKGIILMGTDGSNYQAVALDSSGNLNLTALTGSGNPVIDSYTHLAINLTTGANQVLVASAASKQIWVYGIGFTTSVAGTVSFQDEDDTAITGVMPFATNSGLAISPSGNFAMPIWKLATNKDLEVDIVTSDIDGWLDYAIVSV